MSRLSVLGIIVIVMVMMIIIDGTLLPALHFRRFRLAGHDEAGVFERLPLAGSGTVRREDEMRQSKGGAAMRLGDEEPIGSDAQPTIVMAVADCICGVFRLFPCGAAEKLNVEQTHSSFLLQSSSRRTTWYTSN